VTLSAKANSGSVLGVDVGFSPKRKSSAVCRLAWDSNSIRWHIERFRAVPAERQATMKRVAGVGEIMVAAFDGPLRQGFDRIGVYRMAERMLVKRLQPHIGKPGQSSAPVGISLNVAANNCVMTALEVASIGRAAHDLAIHEQAVVEAFPSSFMGIMLADPSAVQAVRGNRSDTYYQFLAQSGGLQSLVEHLLPGRVPDQSFASVTDHDDRAGLICALTALSVAKCDYSAVGDENGWIILPPRKLIADWAWMLLTDNDAEESGNCLRSFGPHKLVVH